MNRQEHPFDPEVDAAAYVSGHMSSDRRRRFEEHLVDCEPCWEEVRADREGRRLADVAREVAPAGLRDAVRASVTGSVPGARTRLVLPRLVALAAAFALAATLGIYVGASRSSGEPSALQAAMDVYHADGVSGLGLDHAPDLGAVGLRLTGSERMALDGIPVEAFSYRSRAGTSLSLFMADAPFPRAREASSGTSDPTAWEAEHDGVGMMSGSQPSAFLVVTSDHALMERFAGGLSSGQVDITA